MLQEERIAVVVPAYNASRHIDACLASIPHYVDRIIVVDDASDDGTPDRLRQNGDLRLVALRHSQNRGVGAAILTGYLCASRLGMDIAVVMAGDGQMHPDDMPSLLIPLLRGEADYVKGNRLGWPGYQRIIPTSRLVGIRALSVLTRLSTGLSHLTDCQCGYTALRLRVLDRLPIDRIYPRYGFPNDLLNHLALARVRIAERTVRPIYDGQPSYLKIHKVALPILGIIARGTARRLRTQWLRTLADHLKYGQVSSPEAKPGGGGGVAGGGGDPSLWPNFPPPRRSPGEVPA
ncbi:MAG: glycosyltransferase family 2 protein [Bradymonadales bacterium]|nr:glycosyltransferase family 2 protein [Bradymonadales bacterium]